MFVARDQPAVLYMFVRPENYLCWTQQPLRGIIGTNIHNGITVAIKCGDKVFQFNPMETDNG